MADQTNYLQAFILGIIGVAVMLIVGLIVLGELQTTTKTADFYTTADTSTLVQKDSVSNTTYSTVTFGADETFTSLDSVTLKADKIITVREMAKPGEANNDTFVSYRGYNATNMPFTQFVVLNATDSAAVPTSEFTVHNTTTTGIVAVNFTSGNYTGQWVIITYNRTFGKTDDFVTAKNTNVCRLSTCTLYSTTGGSTYAETWQIKLGGAATGGDLGGNNLNITYTYTTRALHEGSSLSSNATGAVILKLATVPTWVGIIIVVALAFIVLGYFYTRRDI